MLTRRRLFGPKPSALRLTATGSPPVESGADMMLASFAPSHIRRYPRRSRGQRATRMPSLGARPRSRTKRLIPDIGKTLSLGRGLAAPGDAALAAADRRMRMAIPSGVGRRMGKVKNRSIELAGRTGQQQR